MPYIEELERSNRLKFISNEIAKMCEEALEINKGKYVNYTIFRGFLKCWRKHHHYEEGRFLQSILNDIAGEFQNRRNEYETGCRKKNGDV